MSRMKLEAGAAFPSLTVPKLGGGTLAPGRAREPRSWQLVVVYRGRHCPLCTRLLSELNDALPDFHELGVDVIAISADSEARATEQVTPLELGFDIGHDLSVEQMQELGLYISHPRSPAESDRPFAEPGVFVVNDAGRLQIVDLSNAPFARPPVASLLAGIRFVRDPKNDYPVRGTFPAEP